MEKFVKDEILLKIDELIEMIKNDNLYKRYVLVSKQMKDNEEIMSIIKNIKLLQKKAVNLEYRKEDISLIEKEIANNLNLLNSYPIYQEYSYLLEDLNSLFQDIKSSLEGYINDLLK